jgi:outer membrane protein assembly factor BamB
MTVKNLMMSQCLVWAAALVCLAAGRPARGDDWPNWRGPNRNGISKEKGWSTTWPAEGPKVLWKESIGTGFASMAVSGGRVYAMGNIRDNDILYCFDAVSGEPIWAQAYPCPLYNKMHEGGPCSTPTVDGDGIYTFSKNGDAVRFDKASGKIVWHRNLVKEMNVQNLTWFFAGSVVPVDEAVVFSAGTSGLALKKTDASIVWTTGLDACGYATAVPARLAGRRCLLIMGTQELYGVDPFTGNVNWSYPWPSYQNINATDPVVIDDTDVFVSTGYNRGGARLRIGADGKVSEVWRNKNMSNQFNASVLWNGCLYGFSGNIGMSGPGNGKLTCLDVNTGDVKWTHEGLGTGSLMLADGKLIVLSESGKLVIVPASPEGYRELASAQILKGRCWTVPVLANGLLYARNAPGDLVCLDLRGKN